MEGKIYCTFCGNQIEKCTCTKEATLEVDKMMDPKNPKKNSNKNITTK